jgi:hypothetical protein
MSEENNEHIQDLLVKIGLGVAAYFFVIKPLLNDVGASDPVAAATVQNAIITNPNENPFSYNFTPFQQAGTNFLRTAQSQVYGSVNNLQQWYQQLNQNQNGTDFTGIQTAVVGENLWSQVNPGFFSSLLSLTSNANTILGCFDSVTTQTQCAGIAAYLYYIYGADLITSITGSLFKRGLTQSDLSNLINKINALPQ